MCTQTVGLIAAELERQGITTVAIQLLRDVAEKVRPPRGLLVPFPHGYPFGKPDAPALQHAVIARALDMLEDDSLQPPALLEFELEAIR